MSRFLYTRQEQIEEEVINTEFQGVVSGGFVGGVIGMGISLIQMAGGMYVFYPQSSYIDSGILQNMLVMTFIGLMLGAAIGGLESATRGFEHAKHTKFASFHKSH